MHLYVVTLYDGAEPRWQRTLQGAHATAKQSADRAQARIELRDYPAHQQAVCDLFNGTRPEGELLKTWRITPRGGLHEGTELPEFAPRRKARPEPSLAPTDAPDAATFWATLQANQPKRKAP